MFLAKHNLMDYSLLLGVESKKGKIKMSAQHNSRNDILSSDSKHVYHIGIIDYLQDYNLTKKIERCIKQPQSEDKYKSVAAAPPKLYAKRFKDFIE